MKSRTWCPSAVLNGAMIITALALVLLLHHVWGHAAASGALPDGSHASVADLIGLTRLSRELGPATPTGRGVVLGHVDGQPGDYLPGTTAPDFQDVTFVLHSGEGKPNGHSDATTRMIVGHAGLAPGIARVDCFAATHWMGSGFLHAGEALGPGLVEPSFHLSATAPAASRPPGQPAMITPARLYTHSWIASITPGYEEILRRIDYLADAQGVMMVVGVNNGAGNPVPPLLASAYNTISVGAWDGQSSGGYTTVEGVGRCKPEIVAPGGLTSFATPVVAAAMARLMEAAQQTGDPDAGRPQVLKAVLLAGADKPPGWHCAPGKPLDDHLGAGRVRVDRSYHILEDGIAGRRQRAGGPASQPATAPSLAASHAVTLTQRDGWSYGNLAPGSGAGAGAGAGSGGADDYAFVMPQAQGELSMVLVWHRRIRGKVFQGMLSGKPYWADTPRLANLGLSLFVRDAEGHETLVAQSVSSVDNLQHIYLPALAAGHYRIHVDRRDALNEPWDYALAWRIEAVGAWW